MGLLRRPFSKEFKLAAVRRLEQGVSVGEVARALEVNPNVLSRWRREFRQGPGNAFPGNGKQRWSEGRIAELERKVGQQTLEIDFAIQRIALEWPCYGRPRITKELRDRGWKVNPKRVYRLMRENNLLCVRKRKFVVTTESNHGRKVYRNLAREIVLTGVDQLWVADITYIRLQEEFVFLAVILDAYSRRVRWRELWKTS